ncbi:MAG TPA: tetratricopeptide repeat protein [Polyangiaceae bacterium]|nr:tetratricopeptide repeat protein [Polyangiaceae bacterium]
MGTALAAARANLEGEILRARNWLIVVGALVVAVLVFVVTRRDAEVPAPPSAVTSASPPPSPRSAVPANSAAGRERDAFVGSAVCAPCHQAQSEAYLGSHHAKALIAPSPELAQARFDGSQFTSKLGGKTLFSMRGDAPFVTTPVAGGKTATLPISYVSGVWPLEQYVVATERGKLQSLGVVWDTRGASEGGSKWFHVYGGPGIAPSDTLFFTAPAQNWNHVCADCHSTRVERRYDTAADSFDTRWAELSVGCEACHGPGAGHVRTAQSGHPVPFSAHLNPSEPWTPSATGSPTPRSQDGIEVEVCAPCHSRRTPLKEGFIASDPFLDSFEPDLLRPARYHADGQVDGEVYEWGSFLQSRMYRSGVKCSDCHNPHSGKLYAQDNSLCVRCHEPKHFDVEAHSHHTGEKAPRCIDCHMPPATFMQIDERRDHSIRIPRPDHSVQFGTPNACNGCHKRESAAWARDALTKWFPTSPKRAHFVEALGRERQGTLDAPRLLRALVEDATVPAIARASALERLGAYASEKTVRTLRTTLASSEPLVVYGAVLGAAQLPPQQRVPLLTPLLEHRLRAVRIAVGKALAGVPTADLPAGVRAALERAFGEVERSFDVSASRPETHVERSAFELARGNLAQAETSLQVALRLQPCLAEADLNLADLERQRGNEAAAERAIRAAIACNPQNAAAHHALGLWQVRAHQTQAAIVSLKKAVELLPSDPRFSYVLAVALAGSGHRDEAIVLLEATLKARPNNASALQALSGYLREAGQTARAAELRQQLDSLLRE